MERNGSTAIWPESINPMIDSGQIAVDLGDIWLVNIYAQNKSVCRERFFTEFAGVVVESTGNNTRRRL